MGLRRRFTAELLEWLDDLCEAGTIPRTSCNYYGASVTAGDRAGLATVNADPSTAFKLYLLASERFEVGNYSHATAMSAGFDVARWGRDDLIPRAVNVDWMDRVGDRRNSKGLNSATPAGRSELRGFFR